VNTAETDAGTLTVNGLLTASGGISATNATLNGTSTIPSGGVLNVNTAAINLNTNGYMRFYNGAALQGNLDFGGNLTSNGAVNVTGTVTSGTGVITPTVTATGDIKYNTSTSLTSQMATLNGYKTSGSISATTTFQTIYTITTSGQGIITVSGTSPSYLGMVMGFFQWLPNGSNASLTQLAASGNGAQAVLAPNTFTGTNAVSFNISGVNLQVKALAPTTLNWYITFL
jgi:hypothetical protein